jgi:hypothetical protein
MIASVGSLKKEFHLEVSESSSVYTKAVWLLCRNFGLRQVKAYVSGVRVSELCGLKSG